MANPEHIRLLKRGAHAWNQWRQEDKRVRPDLSHADLSRHILKSFNFRRTNLRGANLKGSDLTGASMHGADLRSSILANARLDQCDLTRARLSKAIVVGTSFIGAGLEQANLSMTIFRYCDLSRANLFLANLTDSHLHACNVDGTNFELAYFGKTCFTRMYEFDRAVALQLAHHTTESMIDFATLYGSRALPESFQRGLGLPEDLISYLRSILSDPVQFFSIFISYSHLDEDFAQRVHNDLQASGVRCWYAAHDVKPGLKLYEQIDQAIRSHEKLLLILSPNSINSEWVRSEIAKARRREVQEGGRVLFPVLLGMTFEQLMQWECFDADIGKDSAREIREFYIPDFTGWESDNGKYRAQFSRLLDGLRGKHARAAAE